MSMNLHGITIAKIIPIELARLEECAAQPDEVDAELLPFFEEEAKAELQAIELLLQGWSSGDNNEPLHELRRHFHTLKGAANSIGLIRIGALAGAMEDVCRQFNPAYAFVLRNQVIKTCITVLHSIRLLIGEARQPQFSVVKKEQVIQAVEAIIRLQERSVELKGVA